MSGPVPELAEILRQIATTVSAREPRIPMDTRIIAIDGPGGAGKSTFAKQLAAALDSCQVVHTDDFASWDNPVDWWPRLIDEVLEPLSRNEPARFRRSQWEAGEDLGAVEVLPAPRLILEGVTASRQVFRPYLTYSVWIDAAREVRLSRGLKRDGAPSRAQWVKWMAEEDEYRDREHPDAHADLVLSGEQDLWT
ncbi:MAG: hypothetical protein QOH95_1234 [Gaiellaceae bacterium]|nr:hypothetical protein [Gaiellaceae bacterium]